MIGRLYLVKTISERELNFVTNFVVEDVLKDIENWRKSEETGKNSNPVFLVNERLTTLEEQYIEDTKYRPYFEKIYFMLDHSFKQYIISSCTKFIKVLIQKPKYPKETDLSFMRQLKTQFKKVNMLSNDDIRMDTSRYENTIVFISKERPKRTNHEKKKGDEIFKFASMGSSQQAKSDLDILKDDVLSEANLTYYANKRSLWTYKFEKYTIYQNKKLDDQIVKSRLLDIKDELFPENYLECLAEADYNEFIDASLKKLKKDKMKYLQFVKDFIQMFDRKDMSLESFVIKLTIVKKLIERDPETDKLMYKLSKLGLYEKIIAQYIEHSKNSQFCLKICDFIVFSIDRGKRVV